MGKNGGKTEKKRRENGGEKRKISEGKSDENGGEHGERGRNGGMSCRSPFHRVQIRFEVSFSNILLKLDIKEAKELHLHMTSYDVHRSVVNLTSSAV